MILTIRPATPGAAAWLGARLRVEDEAEVLAATGQSGTTIVPLSVSVSAEAYALHLELDPYPALMFGIGEGGIIWLLASPVISRAPLSILREARYWIDHWCEKYGAVHNLVDSRNTLHIRWLNVLSFTMSEGPTLGGIPFYHAKRTHV